MLYMSSSQNQGSILVPLNIGCHNINYNQKGSRFLGITHLKASVVVFFVLHAGLRRPRVGITDC